MAESIIDNSLQEQINDLNSKLIRVTEIEISKSVTLAGHTGSTVFDNYSLSSHIPSGATAVGAMFEWANGSGCYAGNIAVINGKLTLTLFNGSNNSMTISAIRLLIFYTK